jgi:hypothetical protein
MASQHEPLPTDTPGRYFTFTPDEVEALSWGLDLLLAILMGGERRRAPKIDGVELLPALSSVLDQLEKR